MSHEIFLDEASAIADRLARSAIRHQDRLNWVTRLPTNSGAALGNAPRLQSLNASIYSGTAGLALLFARLSRHTDSALHRETAAGAMRHALHNARTVTDRPDGNVGGHWRFGWYLGSLGIAWAGHEVGTILGDDRMVRHADALVAQLAATRHEPHALDIMFGNASAIPTLLDLEAQGVRGAGELAMRFGHELVERAQQAEGGLVWADPNHDGGARLLGFSHGAVGAAWALARLFAATKEEAFRDAALGALDHLDTTFDEKLRNWPRSSDPSGRTGFMTAWCHGAPGIGVGMAGLHAIFRERRMRHALDAARATTLEAIEEAAEYPGRELGYCHGILGNLECLWIMDEHLGALQLEDHRAFGRLLIERHGNAARARWGADAVEYPTAVHHGFYPPLFTGGGAVAHFLLRLYDPASTPAIVFPADRR